MVTEVADTVTLESIRDKQEGGISEEYKKLFKEEITKEINRCKNTLDIKSVLIKIVNLY